MDSITKYLTVGFFSLLLFFVLVLGTATVPRLFQSEWADELNWNGLAKGKLTSKLEARLQEQMVFKEGIRSLWGTLNYWLFKTGQSGVVVGQEGWLYSQEEFGMYKPNLSAFNDNLERIFKYRDILSSLDISLYVVLIPSKVRVVPEKLGYHQLSTDMLATYEVVKQALIDKSVFAVDVRDVFQNLETGRAPYFKTDTHWTQEGAYASALALRNSILETCRTLPWSRAKFELSHGPQMALNGDLAKFIPLGYFKDIVPLEKERMSVPIVSKSEASTEKGAMSLFDDQGNEVVLVGTSYSAIEDWGFAAFLTHVLGTDVLNMAEAGQGPFLPAQKLIASILDGQIAVPKAVIWEIPERYMVMEQESDDLDLVAPKQLAGEISCF